MEKATRKRRPLHILIAGVPGAGKTTSAIRLALGLAGDRGRVGLLDSEGLASDLYGDTYDFDNEEIGSDPTVVHQALAKYSQTYPALVWDGAHGTWETVRAAIGRQPDAYGVWERTRSALGFDGLLHFVESCPCDLIVTVMCEEKYEIGADPKTGKTTMNRLGAMPLQCKEFKGKFDMVLELEADTHFATGHKKNRTELWLDGSAFLITEDHGQQLREWRDQGREWVPWITATTKATIKKFQKALGLPTDDPDMSEADAQALLEDLRAQYKTTKETKSA